MNSSESDGNYRIGMTEVDKWTLLFCSILFMFIIGLGLAFSINVIPYLIGLSILVTVLLCAFFYKYWIQIPSNVTFDSEGMIMHFRARKESKIFWVDVQSLYITNKPGSTTGDGMAYLKDGKIIELSHGAAFELRRRYELARGHPPLENDRFGRIKNQGSN